MRRRKNFQGFGRKGVVSFAVNRHFCVKLLHSEVYHILGLENRGHVGLQDDGVRAAYPEDNNRSDVTQNGEPNSFAQLANILVSHSETQAVFSRFRKEVFEGFGDQVMKLVNIKIKVVPVLFRHSRPSHAGLFDFGNEHRTEEAGVFLAKFTLREVY